MSQDNQISAYLSSFDDSSALAEGAKIIKDLQGKIAERRTYHHLLYWGPHKGVFMYIGLVGFCELVVFSDLVSAFLFLPLIVLPFVVTMARRQFPYIVIEPFKLSTFDQVMTAVVSVAFVLVILPTVVAWLSNAE